MKLTDYPFVDELVAVKIVRITQDGAIASLQDYPQREGFIHRSNIANSWVKNIHNFLAEGELRIARVLNVERTKRSIDLSLRKVSDSEAKRKMEDIKREKRADKLFERFCKENNEDFRKTYSSVLPKLADEFGDLLSAFENASIYGEEPFRKLDLPPKFAETFVAFAKNNIEPPKAIVRGDLELSSFRENGFEAIKQALKKAEGKDVDVEYISAPTYRIKATALDYDKAEKLLSDVAQKIIKEVEAGGGTGTFKRIKEK